MSFTDEEIEKLRKLIPHIDALEEDAKVAEARNLLWKRWRSILVGVAAFLTAALFLWDKFKLFLQAALK